MMSSSDLSQPRAWIAEAAGVAVLTGAGISAESGIPTFRGPGGLWNNYKPEELATPEAFARDPRLVWDWYNWRRELISKALPNPAHQSLVQLEIRKRDLYADHAERRRPARSRGQRQDPPAPRRHLASPLHHLRRELARPPRPAAEAAAALPCGGVARPNVVWFGEPLPDGMMKEAEHAVESRAGLAGDRHAAPSSIPRRV